MNNIQLGLAVEWGKVQCRYAIMLVMEFQL